MCHVPRGPESAPPIPVRRKHLQPSCGARRAWSRVRGWPECGRRDANRPREQGRAVDREVGCTAERDFVAGDGVEALSLPFGQFYQILACCKSQFVSAASRTPAAALASSAGENSAWVLHDARYASSQEASVPSISKIGSSNHIIQSCGYAASAFRQAPPP